MFCCSGRYIRHLRYLIWLCWQIRRSYPRVILALPLTKYDKAVNQLSIYISRCFGFEPPACVILMIDSTKSWIRERFQMFCYFGRYIRHLRYLIRSFWHIRCLHLGTIPVLPLPEHGDAFDFELLQMR